MVNTGEELLDIRPRQLFLLTVFPYLELFFPLIFKHKLSYTITFLVLIPDSIAFVVEISWLYFAAKELLPRLPGDAKMDIGKFKLALRVRTLYYFFGIISFLFWYGFLHQYSVRLFGFLGYPVVRSIKIFAAVYSSYFVARALRSIEYKQMVGLEYAATDTFLIWVFPLGIWFIQPRVNKIIRENKPDLED